jgi:NADP-dependent 3-hydroxy acid dehydrogenase YdfG
MKLIVITGASSGIGLETLRRMSVLEDYRVIGLARNMKKVEGLSKLENIKTYDIDLTSEDQVIKVFREIRDQFGEIDILVNNAGKGLIRLLKETSLSEWEDMLKTNVTSMFLVIREVLKNKKSDQFLHLINISSEAGLEGFATYSAYCSSKFAVTGLSKSLKHELARENIKVDVIYPGDVLTPFMDKCPIDKNLMERYNISVLDEEHMLKASDISQQIENLIKTNKNVDLGDIKIVPSSDFR